MADDRSGPWYVLSFDVEEHDRIEAARGLDCPAALKADYARRMEARTRELLDIVAAAGAKATFFVVGEIAKSHPKLVRDIAAAGHEVASHSWDHRRVNVFTPASFRDDVLKSKDALEQVTGTPVVGFRAPTFSVVRETGWAVEVLAACGMRYDSSIFPVRHDRYGIPDAPRSPFLAEHGGTTLLELPPATWQVFGQNLPVAGGGYFRLFPPYFLRKGLAQLAAQTTPAVGMVYFHPWEFDPDQPRLPLGRVAAWRTYVGTGRTKARLRSLLAAHPFGRAIDVADALAASPEKLPRFHVGTAASAAVGAGI